MTFTPYLNFGGNCREAFARYHEIFGGELNVVGMGDLPDADQAGMPEGMADMVMNASITTDTGGVIMGSDVPPGTFGQQQFMYANFQTPDVEEAKRVWKELSDGGEIEIDGAETFWSPFFGVCRDRFGTQWMVNAEPA